MKIHKALSLNLLPIGTAKRHTLNRLSDTVVRSANDSLTILRDRHPQKRTAFHKLVYTDLRKGGIPAQVACDVVSQVWEGRKTAREFRSVPLRFNLPRSGGFSNTSKGNPVITLCTGGRGKNRIALPLVRDDAYARLSQRLSEGFVAKQLRLCRRKGVFRLWVSLEKDLPDPAPTAHMPVVGDDMGVRTLAAVSVLSDGGVQDQLYFGRDLYPAQRDAGLRRSILQEGVATGAMPDRSRRGMKRLRGWENRFTTTRCWQIAHQVVGLAERHGAAIAIEDLKDLNENTLPKSFKKGRRKTHRMPYAKFRSSLESLALERGVPLVAVPPAYTSRRCSRCGETGVRKGATFHCPKCGYLGNADRNASVNIAKSLRERVNGETSNFVVPQSSRRGGPVNDPGGNDDGRVSVGSQPFHLSEFKPPIYDGR